MLLITFIISLTIMLSKVSTIRSMLKRIPRGPNSFWFRSIGKSKREAAKHFDVSIFCPELADELDLPISDRNIDMEDSLILQRNKVDNVLELLWGPKSELKEKPFRIDFTDNTFKARMSSSSNSELICKAIGKADCVIDMTAGLGRDSLILASARINERQVYMFETNIYLYHLVRDAIQRLQKFNRNLSDRLIIERLNSATDLDRIKQFISTKNHSAISVYLDPMYPMAHTSKRTAKCNKETQYLHRLTGSFSSPDEETRNNELLFQVFLFVTKINLFSNSEM